MKERPILFNSTMVQAILSGRKTQTRRVVKDKTLKSLEIGHQLGECFELADPRSKECGYIQSFCPYGQIGDQLWVRETFCMGRIEEDDNPFTWPKKLYVDNYEGEGAYPIYKQMVIDEEVESVDVVWTPSIHMPRSASRIQLEITNIRIQRLNDISEADAIAEGIKPCISAVEPFQEVFQIPNSPSIYYTAKQAFTDLWQSINGEGSWDKNPWVWVDEFKVIQGGAV